jgi:hypothetical protein
VLAARAERPRALAEREHGSDHDVDQLTRSFFSQPPVESAPESWDDELPPTPMTLDARRAMFATLAMAGGFALLLIGYLVYQRVIMPVPVELGGSAGLPSVESTRDALAPAIGGTAPALRGGASMSSVASAQAAIVGSRASGAAAAPGAMAPSPAPVAAAPAATVDSATAAPAPVDVAAVPAAGAALAAVPVTAEPAAAAPLAVAVAPAPAGAVGGIAPALRGGAMSMAEPAEAEPTLPVTAAAPAPADAARAATMLQAAHALYDRGRRKEALAAYESVLDVDPASPQALSRIGYLHLQAGDDARARQYASRAVELDVTSSEGWIVLGAALEALRDRAGARAAYQQCAASGTGAYAAECRRLAR